MAYVEGKEEMSEMEFLAKLIASVILVVVGGSAAFITSALWDISKAIRETNDPRVVVYNPQTKPFQETPSDS